MATETYKIVRHFSDPNRPCRTRRGLTGLTLEQAQAHCNDPKTHKAGVWFDGYTREGK
jgi:hypothetical protein